MNIGPLLDTMHREAEDHERAAAEQAAYCRGRRDALAELAQRIAAALMAEQAPPAADEPPQITDST